MASFLQDRRRDQNNAVTRDRLSPCTKFEPPVAMVSIDEGKKAMNISSASRVSCRGLMKLMRRVALLVILPAVAAGASNESANARQISARNIPMPSTVSPELQGMIAAGVLPFWNAHPQTREDWKVWVQQRAESALKMLACFT